MIRSLLLLITFMLVRTHGGDKIVFNTYNNKFGRLSKQSDLTQKLLVYNNSSSDITLDSLSTNSPHMTVAVPANQILAKDSTELTLSFSYPQDTTEIKKEHITLYTSAGEYVAVISATLLPLYQVRPSNINLNQLYKADTANIAVTIKNLTSKRTKSAVTYASERICFHSIEDFDSVEVLQLNLFPSRKLGAFKDTVIIATNNDDFPALTIHIEGNAVNQVTPKPEVMDFGEISQRKRHVRSIELVSRRTNRYEVTNMIVKPNFLYTSIIKPSNNYWSVLSVIYPKEKLGPFNGEIKLYLDSAEVPEAVIPVKGVIVP